MNKVTLNTTIVLLRGLGDSGFPPAETLREQVIDTALDENSPDELLGKLLSAYRLAECARREEYEEPEMDLVDDTCDYAAEKLYYKCAIAGYRHALRHEPGVKDATDDDLRESVSWYEFPNMCWEPQLLADVAFIKGYEDGRQALAMRDYFSNEENRKAEGITA